MPYVTIGLEVHAQLLTKTKLFCRCPNIAGEEPNSLVCPVCLGLPGTLPVLNAEAVTMIVKTGLALHCHIAPTSHFARKNYFYPDLPKNYQISQYEEPVCRNGFLPITTAGKTKRVRIQRIHLEEDAGKLMHLPSSEVAVDLNRAGSPLMEIVTEPDLESPEEAIAYLQMLRLTLQALGVCSGNMEEGHLRLEPNISVRLSPEDPLGTKVELKNINSFRFARQAMEWEIKRQLQQIKSGKPIRQETRRYDESRGITLPMRSKEEASDYRYFPEPDLLPLAVSSELVQKIKAFLPELPFQKKTHFMERLHLSEEISDALIQSPDLTALFEEVAAHAPSAVEAAHFLLNELQGKLREKERSWESVRGWAKPLADILHRLHNGSISSSMAKSILDELVSGSSDVETIVREKKLTLITSSDELTALAKELIAENADVVARIQQGKKNAMQFLVGQIMRKTKGRADPKVAQKAIRDLVLKRD